MANREDPKSQKPPRRPDVQDVFKPQTFSNNSPNEEKRDD